MKIILALLIVLSSNAYAERTTTDNTIRTIAGLSIALDWRQTRWMAKNYHKGYSEKNKILGKYPTKQEVDRYFAALFIKHYLINRYTNSENFRVFFNSYVSATHLSASYTGYQIGVQIDF